MSTDWLPGPRTEIPAMCRTWLLYMTADRRTAWGVPAAALSYPGGPHGITAYLGPLAGTGELDPRSDYGYAVYLGIMPPGGATLEQAASKKHYLMEPPKDGEGLQHHRFTRRRRTKDRRRRYI